MLLLGAPQWDLQHPGDAKEDHVAEEELNEEPAPPSTLIDMKKLSLEVDPMILRRVLNTIFKWCERQISSMKIM